MRLKSRHVPQRTCIACRQVRDKKSLIRLVRGEDGGVEIDISGKKPGRGAYLCPKRACWELALKKESLEYALRTRLNISSRQTLTNYAQTLVKES